MRWLRPLALLVLAVSGCMSNCAGSPGTLTTPLTPNRIESEAALVFGSERGTQRIEISGRGQTLLYGPELHLRAMSDDGAVHVLGDSSTNLYVWREGSEPRRLPAFDDRAGTVALSPDGTTLVVSKHADFDLPQRRWGETEDDTLWIVDTRAGSVSPPVPATRQGSVTTMHFETSQRLVLTVDSLDGTGDPEHQSLDLETLERSPEASPHQPAPRCDSVGTLRQDDARLWLERADGSTLELANVEGRVRGFHDHNPTFGGLAWVGACGFVVFDYRRDLYVADVSTGETSRLVDDAFDPRAIGP